ncbi:hypothetical protein CQA01_24240 [Cyclobacterium qasimii]|uniref:Uncharacterized protein n=1 Tax=Cyclobacterium qasimii TaxID=1350429 RepID=A0A512CCT5_9BACT|nr:hypothetical protein CQA01_24240 [Cyclobacterium qasimii]
MAEPVEVTGVQVNIGNSLPILMIVALTKIENFLHFGSKLRFAKLRPAGVVGLRDNLRPLYPRAANG